MAAETTVGQIAVEILAKTEKLEAGLKKAGGGFNAFGGMVAGATAAVVNFGLQAATGAVSGLVGLVSQSFQAIGAAQDLAIALGTDTQALQALQYAAKNTGASSDTLNTALNRMAREGLRPEDLGAVADAISGLKTPAEQAKAAVELFGKSGQELLPLLLSGSEGIKELTDRYVELSGGMSELDVSKVQLAGDLMDDLGIIVKGVADQIAVNLAPFISAAVTKLIDLGVNGQNAVAAVGQGFTWLEGLLKEVAWWTVKIYQGWLSFQYVFQILEVAFTEWYAVIERGFNGISEFLKKATFGKVDLSTSDFFKNWNQQSKAALDETGSKILELQSMLDKEAPQEFIGSIFEAVKTGADEAAQKIVELSETRKRFARDAAYDPEMMKKEKPKTEKLGFAGLLQAGGVSAEAMRAAVRQVQVVSDPQLAVTNKILTDVNASIKKLGMGEAVTV